MKKFKQGDDQEETLIKLSTKEAFLLKTTLAIMIANDAGSFLSNRIPSSGRWDGAFIGSFFPLISIVITQWILFSDYLPKQWFTAGLIGCVISASVMGTINYQISDQIFRMIVQELNIANRLLMGILVSIPQWFILKHKNRYVWVLVNSIGWALAGAILNLNFYLQVNDAVRTFIWEISFVPLGLLISLYLYSYICKPSDQKSIENQRVMETESTSPVESVRAEKCESVEPCDQTGFAISRQAESRSRIL